MMIGKLFSRLDVDAVYKKLDQRIKNVQRIVKVKKIHNRAKADSNFGDSYELPEEPAADYDELVKPYNVFPPENCAGYEVEYLSKDTTSEDAQNGDNDEFDFVETDEEECEEYDVG